MIDDTVQAEKFEAVPFNFGVQNWTEDEYHRDPCPEPALSSSLAKTIINETPLHAWVSSPRLDPDFERTEKAEFDIGNGAHKLYLGKGSDLAIIPAKAFNTNAAKAARDQAYAEGLTPLLTHQFDKVKDMVDAGRFQLQRHECGDPFVDADPDDVEVCIAWEQDGVINRAMLDRIDRKKRIIWDLKTSGVSANPDRLDRVVSDRGYDISNAHYTDGAREVFGGDWTMRFVFQEKTYPYLLSIIDLHPEWIDTARRKVKRARHVWRYCLDSGVWPGYPSKVCTLEAPAYHDAKWYAREVQEDDVKRKTGADVLRLGMEFQAPLNGG